MGNRSRFDSWQKGLELACEEVVAAGHNLEQVIRYPLRRLLRFHQLALARKDRELAQEMRLLRIAVWAERSVFAKEVKKLYDG